MKHRLQIRRRLARKWGQVDIEEIHAVYQAQLASAEQERQSRVKQLLDSIDGLNEEMERERAESAEQHAALQQRIQDLQGQLQTHVHRLHLLGRVSEPLEVSRRICGEGDCVNAVFRDHVCFEHALKRFRSVSED